MNAIPKIPPDAGRFLEVGEHVLDLETLRLVTRPDTKLTPRGAAVLVRLACSAGRTLSRDQLLDDVWRDTTPTPDVLTQAIKDLRRAFGDDLNAPRYIETLPRLGYRLIAPARFMAEMPSSQRPPSAEAGIDVLPSVLPDRANANPRRIAAILTGSVALLAFGIFALLLDRSHAPASTPSASRWRADSHRSITAERGPEGFPRISPDGTRLVYAVGDPDTGRARIVERSIEQSNVVRLTSSEQGNETYPVWLPDGSAVSFLRYVDKTCKIIVVPALGGPERVLDGCYAGLVTPFSWSLDGKRVITTMPSRKGVLDMKIMSTPTNGHQESWLDYQHDLSDTDLDARYSPDGQWIAFRRGSNPFSDVFVVSAAGGHVRQLTHLASRMRGIDWTRDGSAVIFSSGHAGAQTLYLVDVADGHVEALGVGPAEFPSAARSNNTVVYEIPRLKTQLSRISLTEGEVPQDLLPSTGSDNSPTPSPIDERLAFISDRGGSQQLWLHDTASGEILPLTEPAEPNVRFPVWRADGARILATVRDDSGGHLIEIDIASQTRRLVSAADEDVRNGAYGLRPGSFIAVVNSTDHRTDLIEFERVDGREASRRTLAHDVGRADLDRVSNAIYFTRIASAGLFKLDGTTGKETLVTAKIYPSHLDGWKVHDGRVFSIEPHATGPSEIHVLDPDSNKDQRLAVIPSSLGDLNFGIAPDGSSVVISRVVTEDNDVGAIDLQRR
ncbi:MAG: winged helix-turn-helix domain-containing protein [Dokdonella sp.]